MSDQQGRRSEIRSFRDAHCFLWERGQVMPGRKTRRVLGVFPVLMSAGCDLRNTRRFLRAMTDNRCVEYTDRHRGHIIVYEPERQAVRARPASEPPASDPGVVTSSAIIKALRSACRAEKDEQCVVRNARQRLVNKHKARNIDGAEALLRRVAAEGLIHWDVERDTATVFAVQAPAAAEMCAPAATFLVAAAPVLSVAPSPTEHTAGVPRRLGRRTGADRARAAIYLGERLDDLYQLLFAACLHGSNVVKYPFKVLLDSHPTTALSKQECQQALRLMGEKGWIDLDSNGHKAHLIRVVETVTPGATTTPAPAGTEDAQIAQWMRGRKGKSQFFAGMAADVALLETLLAHGLAGDRLADPTFRAQWQSAMERVLEDHAAAVERLRAGMATLGLK